MTMVNDVSLKQKTYDENDTRLNDKDDNGIATVRTQVA